MGFFVSPDKAVVVKPLHPLAGVEAKECIAEEYVGKRLDTADVLIKK